MVIGPELDQIERSGAADEQVPGFVNASGRWVPRDTVHSVVAGTNVTVDNTDPFNPVISASGGGGTGSLTVQDENGTVATGVTQLDFQGAGVTATAGTGEVIVTIPGGGGGGSSSNYPPGSADKPPASPNAKDDEFDGTSTVTWSTTPTAPNAWDINTARASHAYLKASGSGAAYVGKHQAIPASYPFTITAKVSSTARANYQRGGGIILGPASPTSTSNLVYLGSLYNAGRSVERIAAQFGGTFVSQTAAALPGYWGPVYLKLVATSATSISSYASTDGFNWMPVETGLNPGFTPGVIGLALNDETAGSGCEAWFDFFRVS